MLYLQYKSGLKDTVLGRGGGGGFGSYLSKLFCNTHGDYSEYKPYDIFIISEISSFALLIGRTTFFTSEILSFAFCLTKVAQNLTFVGQKFTDKSQCQ